MSLISIRNLVKKYEENYVLAGIDLDIESGEVKVIMGPSGCGKTTLIMCLNRLVEPDSGDIYIHGENIMALELIFNNYEKIWLCISKLCSISPFNSARKYYSWITEIMRHESAASQ